MSVYIQSANQISVQKPLSDEWFDNPILYDAPRVSTINPDFAPYFSSLSSRRMCMLLKRAVLLSRLTLQEVSVEMPDAIISGTGLGCIDNTEKFLYSIRENSEQFLQPTFFMQSTHNILSSTIAIDLKCHGYNNTFVHRGASFENVLLDAILQMEQERAQTVLVGGYDELTNDYYQFFNRIGVWDFASATSPSSLTSSASPASYTSVASPALPASPASCTTPASLTSVELSASPTSSAPVASSAVSASAPSASPSSPVSPKKRCFAGEAAVSMLLSNSRNNLTVCEINDVELMHKPTNGQMQESLDILLSKAGCTLSDIDAVLTGLNTHIVYDKVYRDAIDHLFRNIPVLQYKHLFGESFSSSALAVYVAQTCLRKGYAPAILSTDNDKDINDIQRILVYNHYRNKTHSFILLSSCSN